jgi:hypothetical protein
MNFITGNKFRKLADLVIDQHNPHYNLSHRPKVIFLYTDWLNMFEKQILPQINWDFVLITHNADQSAPNQCVDILHNPFLKKWYAMNVDYQHPKLQPIPIGIANEQWAHGNEEILRKVMEMDIPKTGFCYCNFSLHTHPSRHRIYNLLKNIDWITVETEQLHFEEYLKKLKSFEYVISPRGNSVDCHRIWESLYVGTTPIVERSLALNEFCDKLPIHTVVWQQHLEKHTTWGFRVKKMINEPKTLDYADMDFWIQQIKNA